MDYIKGDNAMRIRQRPITKRALNALETKNTIFETALTLFTEYGFENVTIDEITKTAGFSKGSFYTHFETKESILVEQFRKIDDEYDIVFEKIDENMTASERLLLLVRTMTEYCHNICGLEKIRIVYANQISPSRSFKILDNKERHIYRYLEDIVERGRKNNEFHIDLPDDELTELLMRHCRSIMFDWCLIGESFDVIEEGQKFFKIIIDSIAKK